MYILKMIYWRNYIYLNTVINQLWRPLHLEHPKTLHIELIWPHYVLSVGFLDVLSVRVQNFGKHDVLSDIWHYIPIVSYSFI